MSEEEKPVELINAATKVEAATAHTNGRNFTRVNNIRMRQKIGIELSPANQKFIKGYNRLISTLPPKPTPRINTSKNLRRPSSIIHAPRTNGEKNSVLKMFEKGLFPPKSGGKRTKKRSKKGKKTRKH